MRCSWWSVTELPVSGPFLTLNCSSSGYLNIMDLPINFSNGALKPRYLFKSEVNSYPSEDAAQNPEPQRGFWSIFVRAEGREEGTNGFKGGRAPWSRNSTHSEPGALPRATLLRDRKPPLRAVEGEQGQNSPGLERQPGSLLRCEHRPEAT